MNKIIIFAPHEDDETICCAGVIRRAINNGSNVKLVLITTGDYSEAKNRIQLTCNAMTLLGLNKQDIIYLGYGDYQVLGPAYLSKNQPKDIFPGIKGRKTYGFPEIGIVDYHYQKYGVHADYNYENIFNDIYTIIKKNLPQDIYLTSQMEHHPDHSSTAFFVISAILEIKKTMDYSPTIHEFMVYKNGLPQNNLNALEPVLDYESNMNSTSPYNWCFRESIPVPDEMYASIESGKNLKAQAFNIYGNYVSHLTRFIKSDEVFWSKTMSSLSYNATVTASSQNNNTQQYCTNVINGLTVGYPYANSFFSFYSNEWATLGEIAGAWIKLSWSNLIQANRIILYDRPNLTDQIIRATLTFSDGSQIGIGPLVNNGSPYIVNFPTKTFSWVKLTVVEGTGYNIGLSEFEVYLI
jgi:LmbE family N-acetylglucosaminyl deacetylase